jgi:CRP-like cAMP-binding protein
MTGRARVFRKESVRIPLVANAADPAEVVFLAECTAEDWTRILRYCDHRRFAIGETLVREGHADRALMILTSGSLEVSITDENGVPVVLDRIHAPSLVGEVAFLDGGPRSATLVATSDGELLRLDFDAFESLSAAMPALGRALLLEAGRVVALRFRQTRRGSAR